MTALLQVSLGAKVDATDGLLGSVRAVVLAPIGGDIGHRRSERHRGKPFENLAGVRPGTIDHVVADQRAEPRDAGTARGAR